jgi:hypothetical protein
MVRGGSILNSHFQFESQFRPSIVAVQVRSCCPALIPHYYYRRVAHVAASRNLTKLYSGKDNVIRRAEMLKELGVKHSKTLPAGLVEAALEVPALSATPEDESERVQGGG